MVILAIPYRSRERSPRENPAPPHRGRKAAMRPSEVSLRNRERHAALPGQSPRAGPILQREAPRSSDGTDAMAWRCDQKGSRDACSACEGCGADTPVRFRRRTFAGVRLGTDGR